MEALDLKSAERQIINNGPARQNDRSHKSVTMKNQRNSILANPLAFYRDSLHGAQEGTDREQRLSVVNSIVNLQRRESVISNQIQLSQSLQ